MAWFVTEYQGYNTVHRCDMTVASASLIEKKRPVLVSLDLGTYIAGTATSHSLNRTGRAQCELKHHKEQYR